jgi:hypothetical protein
VRASMRHFPGTDSVQVATAGGLLRAGSPLLAALRGKLASGMPRAQLSDAIGAVDAPVGALRLAAELLAT